MAFPFKRILVPVDFDQSSLKALEIAAKIAQQNDGTALFYISCRSIST
jgi:nucleotide-binding universal stress UspA family protein